MNGGKYTEIQSDNNTIDKQIQSVDGSVMEENEIVKRNDADMSLREREMCSESLRSEISESAKISRYNIDKKLTSPTEYQPGEIVLLKADAVSKRGKLFRDLKRFSLSFRNIRILLYTLALLSGPARRKVKVKVDKNSSLTTEAGTLAQIIMKVANYTKALKSY